MLFNPFIFLCFPEITFDWYSFLDTSLQRISLIKVDFPLPDTPVIQVKVPKGIFTSIFFRLFSSAPTIVKNFLFPFLLFVGMSIFNFPLRYFPVILFSFSITSFGVPLAIISPP